MSSLTLTTFNLNAEKAISVGSLTSHADVFIHQTFFNYPTTSTGWSWVQIFIVTGDINSNGDVIYLVSTISKLYQHSTHMDLTQMTNSLVNTIARGDMCHPHTTLPGILLLSLTAWLVLSIEETLSHCVHASRGCHLHNKKIRAQTPQRAKIAREGDAGGSRRVSRTHIEAVLFRRYLPTREARERSKRVAIQRTFQCQLSVYFRGFRGEGVASSLFSAIILLKNMNPPNLGWSSLDGEEWWAQSRDITFDASVPLLMLLMLLWVNPASDWSNDRGRRLVSGVGVGGVILAWWVTFMDDCLYCFSVELLGKVLALRKESDL